MIGISKQTETTITYLLPGPELALDRFPVNEKLVNVCIASHSQYSYSKTTEIPTERRQSILDEIAVDYLIGALTVHFSELIDQLKWGDIHISNHTTANLTSKARINQTLNRETFRSFQLMSPMHHVLAGTIRKSYDSRCSSWHGKHF